MEEERERLYKVESLEILEYVKQSVEILMNMKGDEFDVYQKNKEFHEKVKKKDEERGKSAENLFVSHSASISDTFNPLFLLL